MTPSSGSLSTQRTHWIPRLIRPYQINLLLLGPYLPKIFQIEKKKKIHIFNTCFLCLAYIVLVLRGSRNTITNIWSPIRTIFKQEMPNVLIFIGFFNDIHVFLFYFTYLPALPFHLGRPSNNKLIWHGLKNIEQDAWSCELQLR